MRLQNILFHLSSRPEIIANNCHVWFGIGSRMFISLPIINFQKVTEYTNNLMKGITPLITDIGLYYYCENNEIGSRPLSLPHWETIDINTTGNAVLILNQLSDAHPSWLFDSNRV
jgi:hypothetical protein